MGRSSQQGISVVEALVGLSIFALVLIFVSDTLSLFLRTVHAAQQHTAAVYLATDGQELVRYLRDDSWDTFSSLAEKTPLYLAVSTSTITTTTTPEVLDGTYRRSFVLRPIYRDSNDNIVASTTSGATLDSGSRLVQVRVAVGTATTTEQALLTNIFNQ